MLINKKYIVTGSSTGIGKSISENLLNEGAIVIGISSKTDNSKNKNKNFFHYNIDLSNTLKSFNGILKIIKDNKNIDGIVSNAGNGIFQSLENFSHIQIQNFINLNLTSHIMVTRALLPHLKKNKSGNIIFIGSESALKGKKFGSLYSACKFGLRGFSQSIREETLNNNVKVSIINPGMVKTPFFKELNFIHGKNSDEFIEASDIAKVVLDILNLRDGTVVEEINLSPLKKVFESNKN